MNSAASILTNLRIVFVALASLLVIGCEPDRIEPEGEAEIREIEVSSFSEVDVSNAFAVYVTFSSTEEKVEIETNVNLHQHLETEVTSGRLRIRVKPNISIQGPAVLNAYITTAAIDFYRGSGATDFRIDDKLVAQEVEIDLSGASSLVGEIEAERLDVNLSGASELDLSGLADVVDVRASGASEIGSYSFQTNDLDVNLSGGSEVELTVEDKISITASGGSVLRYRGNAAITQQTLTGSSEVVKVD